MSLRYPAPRSVIATIEYPEYEGMRTLLLSYGIDPSIKPTEVDENNQPLGTMVDVYVPLLQVEKATAILAGNLPMQPSLQYPKWFDNFPVLKRPFVLPFLLAIAIVAVCIAITMFTTK